MKSVELFAGAGGLALGAAAAGFQKVAVIEWDRDACEAINHNKRLDGELMHHWPADIRPTDARAVDFSAFGDDIDFISGGPPCQPFSLGGKHAGYRDDRDMFPQAVRAVRELRPRAFVFENVKGLLREKFTAYVQYIRLQLTYPDLVRALDEDWAEHLARLEKHHTAGGGGLTYQVVMQLLNAADYGVPQRRERVFFVGFRANLGISGWHFPKSTHSQDALLWSQYVTGEYWGEHGMARQMVPDRLRTRVAKLSQELMLPAERRWLTVRDALWGAGNPLPDPRAKAAARIPNHVFQDGARAYVGHTGSPPDEPAKTLKAGDHGVPGGENMVAFPDGAVRYFTVRESARLQTFPDTYEFPGSWTENMRQLGNAVPMRLGYVICASVKEALQQQARRLKVVA